MNLCQRNARVFMCQYNQMPSVLSPEHCNLFHRGYTNEGMGFSFNVARFWNRHRKENEFNNLFYDIMMPDLMDNHTVQDIIFPETSGPSYGMKLTLKLNR